VFFIEVLIEILFGEVLWFLGAISRCPSKSFVPNPGTKGFSLPSGLGDSFSKEYFRI